MGRQISKAYKSVWDAISATPEEAAEMEFRSTLLMGLKDWLDSSGLSNARAGRRLRVSTARVGALRDSGAVTKFSLISLLVLSRRAKLEIRIGKYSIL